MFVLQTNLYDYNVKLLQAKQSTTKKAYTALNYGSHNPLTYNLDQYVAKNV